MGWQGCTNCLGKLRVLVIGALEEEMLTLLVIMMVVTLHRALFLFPLSCKVDIFIPIFIFEEIEVQRHCVTCPLPRITQ